MKVLTKSIRVFKTMIIAGGLLLATHVAVAQQEVAPDHFDGNGAGAAQKVRPVKARQKATAHKAAAKHVASAKKSSGTEAAGK